MGFEGHMLKMDPSGARWHLAIRRVSSCVMVVVVVESGSGRRTRRSAAARWRWRMWLEAPRRARRRVPSRRRGARTVARAAVTRSASA